MILKGTFIRMAARGRKTTRSPKGGGLAQDGLYAYSRNPMYLGTFLIGTGFTLIIWPWWAVGIFTILFYLRFLPLVRSEEVHLKNLFGQVYVDYCNRVPRIFPKFNSIQKMDFRVDCPWEEIWMTKERRFLWILPLVVIAAEVIQETVVFKSTISLYLLLPFVLAIGVFLFSFLYEYRLKYGKNSK